MTRVKVVEHDYGFSAVRTGTPTIVAYGRTAAQARAKAARQLRSFRRWLRENRPARRIAS